MNEAQFAALEALADAAPKSYLKRSQGGSTLLRQLYAQAADAQLVPAEAADDIARLHGLFDVALDHGMGSLVCDYIAEVCSDRLLTSSDPVEAFLLDGECVRRWAAKKLTVSQGRLTTWLSRGISSLGSSAAVVPKELSKLRVLQLVFRALAQSTQQPTQQFGAARATAAAAAAAPAALPEVADAERLTQCAQVVTWLSHQPLSFERPSGRYSSAQEWRSVAAKRRDSCGPLGLFLTDMLAALASHGVASLTYPAGSTDKLLSTLFLTGDASQEALHAKLALLTYHLLDGGFLSAEAIAEGLKHEFGVLRDTAHAWLLMQLLDGSHVPDTGAASLRQAVSMVPRVDGSSLPSKAAQVFQEQMRPDIALRLVRQRAGPAAAAGADAAALLSDACIALGARLANGLLVEGYLVVLDHLAAVGAADRPSHARLLVQQLLDWARSMGCLNTAIRLHFEGPEEEALLEWLEHAAGEGQQACALLLPLYHVMRGRTPEALLAYNRLCPANPAGEEQAYVLELLRNAARMLPAPQRALVVRQAGIPALLIADSGADKGGEGTSLVARLPELAAEGMPQLVSMGPSAVEAPLVGSIPAIVDGQRAAQEHQQQRHQFLAAAAAAGSGAGTPAAVGAAAVQPAGHAVPPPPPQPLLFAQPEPGSLEGSAIPPPTFTFAQPAVFAPAAKNVGKLASHSDFDQALGFGGTTAAKGKRRRQPAFR